MAANKPIQKSIRMSEQVFDIINKRGTADEGLAEKFERLVLDYEFSEKERKAKLSQLDKEIKAKTAERDKLDNEIWSKRNLLYGVNSLIEKLKDVTKQTDKVLEVISKG